MKSLTECPRCGLIAVQPETESIVSHCRNCGHTVEPEPVSKDERVAGIETANGRLVNRLYAAISSRIEAEVDHRHNHCYATIMRRSETMDDLQASLRLLLDKLDQTDERLELLELKNNTWRLNPMWVESLPPNPNLENTMKKLHGYQKISHKKTVYWRRDDGYWFSWMGLFGLREVPRSMNDRLEKLYWQMVNGYEPELESLVEKAKKLRPVVDENACPICSSAVNGSVPCPNCGYTFGAPNPYIDDAYRESIAKQKDRHAWMNGQWIGDELVKDEAPIVTAGVDLGSSEGDYSNLVVISTTAPSSAGHDWVKKKFEEPVRPSEDDMMSKPANPHLADAAKYAEQVAQMLQRRGRGQRKPQHRDIGLRVDRYGNVKVVESEICEDAVDEKRRRVYYQNIVYRVCNELDRIIKGSVVCGTVNDPSNQTEEAVTLLVETLLSYQNEKETQKQPKEATSGTETQREASSESEGP